MKMFLRDLFRGPKHWKEYHGIFLFLILAAPIAIIWATHMTAEYDKSMREPNIPLGKIVGTRRIVSGGILGSTIYTEVVSENKSVLVDGNYSASVGDSVYLKKNGFVYTLCSSEHVCVNLVKETGK